MREIKFRSWSEQTKKMVPWGFIKDGFFSPATVGGVNMFDMPQMQFTGLTDKNGTPIYEGDIVRYHDTRISDDEPFHVDHVIEWEWSIGYDDTGIGYQLSREETGKYEVIGNIYQTPELLQDYKPMEEK